MTRDSFRRLVFWTGIVALLFTGGQIWAQTDITGRWKIELQRPERARRGAEAEPAKPQRGPFGEMILELSVEGQVLQGQLVMKRGERERSFPIEEGKIEGSKFSFKTRMKTPRGEQVILWEGELKGDVLEGTRRVEGRGRGMPFTAKRIT